jgi:hypothetical protein
LGLAIVHIFAPTLKQKRAFYIGGVANLQQDMQNFMQILEHKTLGET